MDENATSKQLREKYQAILKQVWRVRDNCPICDSSWWNLGDLVDVQVRGTPSEALAAALMEQSRVYVYVPVTCIYCGYTIFFHTGVLDVRDQEETKAVPPLRAPGEPK